MDTNNIDKNTDYNKKSPTNPNDKENDSDESDAALLLFTCAPDEANINPNTNGIIDSCNNNIVSENNEPTTDAPLTKRTLDNSPTNDECKNNSKRTKLDSTELTPNSPIHDSPPTPGEPHTPLSEPTPDFSTEITNLDDFQGRGLIRYKAKIDSLHFPQNASHFQNKDIRVLSNPPLYLREMPWRILLFRRLNDCNIGMFAQCDPECKSAFPSWNCFATAVLTLVNQLDPEKTIVRELSHDFHTRCNDWGFSTMFKMRNDYLDDDKGYVVDGYIEVTAKIISDAPHGFSWDSKKHSGYVGLRNQGATCYMNSLLQSLFFTNKLRRCVYQIPTIYIREQEVTFSIPLALQILFYDLQHCDKMVNTKKLTKAFGWKTLDSFMQHDVQEMCRVLLDKIEDTMKNTCVDGAVANLFEGKMESYIRCTNIERVSLRKETFFDIQLNVKGKSSIYESFDDYICEEMLDGDNKYDAGDQGFQEARKGVVFLKFPPVLYLHLMRFQFDTLTGVYDKINDKFEYPYEIDLSKYLKSTPGTPITPLLYNLHTILVHSGDNNGGHYVAYLSPKADNNWFKFDDEIVFRVSSDEAIEANFGGKDDNSSLSSINAYMLVYIAKDSIGEILREVTDEDIPEALHNWMDIDKQQEAQKRKEKQEAHLYMNVTLLTDEHFKCNHGYDLYRNCDIPTTTLKIKKTTTVTEFIDLIAPNFNTLPDKIRIWPMQQRSNNSFRPIATADETSENLNSTMTSFTSYSKPNPLFVYVELAKQNSDLPNFNFHSDFLTFFKYFDIEKQMLSYVGGLILPISTVLNDVTYFCELVGLPETTGFKFYEEVVSEHIRPLDSFISISDHKELYDGDIIIFERSDVTTDTILTLPDHSSPYHSVLEYFSAYSKRLYVIFREMHNPSDYGMMLHIHKDVLFQDLLRLIGDLIQHDYKKLQLFKTKFPQDFFPYDLNSFKCQLSFSELYPFTFHRSDQFQTILYKKLEIRASDLPNNVEFKFNILNDHGVSLHQCQLYADKLELMETIIQRLKDKYQLDSAEYRAFTVYDNKIFEVIPFAKKANSLNTHLIYIEKIPTAQLGLLTDNQSLVQVVHFQNSLSNSFGIPFLILFTDGDSVCLVRKRIQEHLNIADAEIKRYKLCFVQGTVLLKVLIDETEIIHTKPKIESSYIRNTYTLNVIGVSLNALIFGIDHIDKNRKSSRYFPERSIKIHN